MKKLLFLIMALLVAPAMADVELSIVDNGDLTADIVVTVTAPDLNGAGDSLVAGLGLDASVDVGTIVAVTNYMTTGESVDTAEGYGIYMGTITFTGGDPEDILDVGTPVAPADAPDTPGQLGTPAIVLEFGCLYDVAVPEDAPLAATTLCTIEVSEVATLTLAGNATRGGVVLIGGGAPSTTNLPVSELIDGGPGPCLTLETAVFPEGHPRAGENYHQEWLDAGSPDCWCYPRNCWGDADGTMFSGKWVLTTDLTEFINSWNKEPEDTGFNICADFDHALFSGKRVLTPDLTIFIASWNQDLDDMDNCGGTLVPPE